MSFRRGCGLVFSFTRWSDLARVNSTLHILDVLHNAIMVLCSIFITILGNVWPGFGLFSWTPRVLKRKFVEAEAFTRERFTLSLLSSEFGFGTDDFHNIYGIRNNNNTAYKYIRHNNFYWIQSIRRRARFTLKIRVVALTLVSWFLPRCRTAH